LLGETFVAEHDIYAELLKFIIEFVTVEWSYCFSEADKHQLLDVFFKRCSPSISLMTLCQIIGTKINGKHQRDSSEQVMLLEVSRWLVPFTENQSTRLLLEVTTDDTCSKFTAHRQLNTQW